MSLDKAIASGKEHRKQLSNIEKPKPLTRLVVITVLVLIAKIIACTLPKSGCLKQI